MKKIILLFMLMVSTLYAGIPLSSNFTVNTALPIEDRMSVANVTARDAIPTLRRWEGMLVYVVAEQKHFTLISGVTNTDWVELAGGGGGGNLVAWSTGIVYAIGDTVIESNKIYVSTSAHTSGVFAADLLAGYWTELSATDLTTASGVLPIANGGTGSNLQTFVDITSDQSIAGEKFFTGSGALDLVKVDHSGTGDGVDVNHAGVGNAVKITHSGSGDALKITNTGTGDAVDVTGNGIFSGTLTASNISGSTSGTNTGDQSLAGLVDLTTNQTIAGVKTFSSTITGSIDGNAATVTTNANLTGAITSVGNATSLGAITSADLNAALDVVQGTGSVVFSNSPGLTTPDIGDATGTSLALGGVKNANAVLDVQSTTKAFLPPRMTTTQKNAIPSPVEGMVVYDITIDALQFYNGSSWVSNPASFANYVKTPNLTTPKMGSAKINASGVALVDNGDMMLGNCSLPGATGRFVCNFETGFFTSNVVCTATQFNNSGGTIVPVVFIETLSTSTIEVRTVTNGAYSFDAFFLMCHGE